LLGALKRRRLLGATSRIVKPAFGFTSAVATALFSAFFKEFCHAMFIEKY
jgi:hypothetical protein